MCAWKPSYPQELSNVAAMACVREEDCKFEVAVCESSQDGAGAAALRDARTATPAGTRKNFRRLTGIVSPRRKRRPYAKKVLKTDRSTPGKPRNTPVHGNKLQCIATHMHVDGCEQRSRPAGKTNPNPRRQNLRETIEAKHMASLFQICLLQSKVRRVSWRFAIVQIEIRVICEE